MGRSPCGEKNGLKKGPWTQEEDAKLMQYIQKHGPGNWRTLPNNAGLQRCGKSCRLRWTNYLRPDIKRGRFSFEEEESIIQLHSVLGNKWSAIAARLPGRTDNEIKNYWNTHIRKRLVRMGIDPVTHASRLDFLNLSSFLSSAQLNFANLINLQNILNPEMLRLASLLLSNHDQNSDAMLLAQNLEENQPNNSSLVQQKGLGSISDQTQILMESNSRQFSTNMGCQDLQENYQTPSSMGNGAMLPNYGSDNSWINGSENVNLMSRLMNNGHNFQLDSVSSTPLSSSVNPTPLNSSSTFINSSSTEDEKDSFCSNMLFEIPESLNFDDFIM